MLLFALVGLALSGLAGAGADPAPAPRVATIQHGNVYAQTLGAAPEQLTHDGRLTTFAFSSRGDLAALSEKQLLVRTTDGQTRVYPVSGYVPPLAWSPDGKLLAVFFGDALHVLDLDT